MPPALRSPPVHADTHVESCQHPAHHRALRQHIIPIALAAQPVPNLPRLRALALFGRRSVEPAEPPCCRRPKTITRPELPVDTARRGSPFAGRGQNKTGRSFDHLGSSAGLGTRIPAALAALN